jgi:hypothetical protein
MKAIFMKLLHSIYLDAIQMVTIGRENQNVALFLIQLCHSNSVMMNHLWNLFEHQDHSVIRAIESIQRIVAHYFAVPNSTMSLMTTVAVALCNIKSGSSSSSKSTTTSHKRSTSLLSKRVTTLFYDDLYRNMLSQSSPSSPSSSRELFHQLEEFVSDQYMASIALQLYNYVQVRYHNADRGSENCSTGNSGTDEDAVELHTSTVFSMFVERISSALDGTNNNDVGSKLSDIILNDNDRRSIISYITKIIRSTYGTVTTDSVFTKLDLFHDEVAYHQTSIQNRVRCKINELIVLLDNCIILDDVHRCIDSLLLFNGETSGYDHPLNEGDNHSAVFVPCPRRDHVRALVHEIDSEDNDNNNKRTLLLINVPGIMYRLIQNRVVITEIEWYQAFLDHVQSNNYAPTTKNIEVATTNDWFHIFGCGIRHLQFSGLIRRNEGRNHSIQYERTALVWCGGD